MISIQQITRRERERMMRRKEIMDAARTVFAHKGFNDAKLEDVAELAEFGKGTIYNYFDNKEGLFKSVLEDSFEMIKGIAEESFRAEIPFQEKVERFIRAELTFFFDNLDMIQLMMRESHHLKTGNPLMHLFPQLLEIISDTISAEQKKGGIMQTGDPMGLAVMLFNMLIGQCSCRVYSRLHENLHAGEDGSPAPVVDMAQVSLQKLFGDMTKAQIAQEIESATALIHTVYFHGIAPRT